MQSPKQERITTQNTDESSALQKEYNAIGKLFEIYRSTYFQKGKDMNKSCKIVA